MTMKVCPFCAESILDAAIVCRYCHRDINVRPVAPPLPGTVQPRAGTSMVRALGWIVGVAGALFLALYVVSWWQVTYGEMDLAEARRLVAMMEADGIVRERQCGPNSTRMPASAWRALPNDHIRRTTLRVLARVCSAESGDRTMTLFDVVPGPTLAIFDGMTVK